MNKTKGFLGIELALLFVMLGIFLLTGSQNLPWYKAAAGWALIVFFGSLLVFAVWKITQRKTP